MMPHDRRLSIRKTPKHLGYLSLPFNNGGFVLDVSEGGLGFQAIAPIKAVGPIRFRFAIDSPDRITAVGELAWVDETGRAGGLRFTQLPDGVREQIRDWTGQSKVSAIAIPEARTTTAVEAVPSVEPHPAPTSVETLAEGTIEAEAAPPPESALPPAVDAPGAEPAVAGESAPAHDVGLATVAATRNSPAHKLKPPIYSGSSTPFSMFPVALESETVPPDAAPGSAGIRHPIAAVGLTIALAFFLSIPIFAYLSSGRVGDLLFHWSQKLWSGTYSQPISPDSAPQADATTDPAKLPQQ
jgi:hypothetical protein